MNIVSLFEEKVSQYPNSIAIVSKDKTLTYNEVNAAANKLAHVLAKSGIKKGDYIGICMQRSPEFIIAITAVLKLGAVYVPIDVSYPKQRISYMLQNSGIAFLISKSEHRDLLTGYQITTMYMDEIRKKLEHEDAGNIPLQIHETDAVYVMYTSGSTGTPKGSIITHQAITRLTNESGYIEILPTDNFSHFSNVSFDASTFEIWSALLNGARLTLIEPATLLDINELHQCIVKNGITTMFITTALFNHLVHENPGMFSTVKYVLFGGEKANAFFANKVLEHGKPLHLLNAYGPTENTVFSTTFEITDSFMPEESVPIGKVIKGTTAWILDGEKKPVQQGENGELFLGGTGIALGYVNRPDVTAEVFIPNPFTDGSDMLYKTGDIVRELPDGNIVYIGRTDTMVKIRGYRIELAEIEKHIVSYPGITEAFVTYTEDEAGDKELMSFFKTEPRTEVLAAELRRYLQDRMPSYMVPPVLERVDSFPMTPNGKIDKNELLKSWLKKNQSVSITATDDVEKMVEIWESVFHIHPLEPTANFYELGGHSFIAFQIMQKVKAEFDVEMPLRFIFESPTPVVLTIRLRKYRELLHADGTLSLLLPIRKEGTKIPIVMVPPFDTIHRLYDFTDIIPDEYPVYGFEPLYFSESSEHVHSIEEIARLYLGDVLKTMNGSPFLLGGWSLGGVIAFEMARIIKTELHEDIPLFFLDLEELEDDSYFFKTTSRIRRNYLRAFYACEKWLYFLSVYKFRMIMKVYKSVIRRFYIMILKKNVKEIERAKIVSTGWPVALRKAQSAAFASYKAKPLDIDAVNFIAIDRYRPPVERKSGLRKFITGKYSEVLVEGDHNNFLELPYVRDLVKKFEQYLKTHSN
jgi:amino acid adenylation domain-containing protein